MANKAQAELYGAIARDGGTHTVVDRMQTRGSSTRRFGLHDYEALDSSIVQMIVSGRHA